MKPFITRSNPSSSADEFAAATKTSQSSAGNTRSPFGNRHFPLTRRHARTLLREFVDQIGW